LIVLAEVVVDTRETGKSIDVVRIARQNFLECLNRHLSVLLVLFTASARHKLLSICGREIDLSRREVRIQLNRLLEVLPRVLVMRLSERADPLVEVVPCLELRAARCSESQDRQEGEH